jgi:formylglycine-generating enzyme required for sulfatase activity/tRNA A-37 threonylcarbamoyl transferase component Bud32
VNSANAANACLEQRELEQLALGELDEERLESAQAHLKCCSKCLQRLRELDKDDSLTAAMRAIPAVQKQLSSLIEPIQQLLDQFHGHDTSSVQAALLHLSGADGSTNSASQPDCSLDVGQVLGNYVLEGLLGRGGMGVVFKARHRRMDRVVALKVLSPRTRRDAAAALRFHSEVKALARLNHPQIVTAHDADEADGVHFLVMEYVDGCDLMSLVKESGPLPVATAVAYAVQAAQGLAYAHEQGIIHRDIKPANLVLDRQGVIKVLDLGLARLGDVAESSDATDPPLTGSTAGGASESLTESGHLTCGTVMGTIDFMAPEQARSASRVDERSDIYSLGCTLYYLLTGQTVPSGHTPAEKLAALSEQAAPSARSLRGEIPRQLDAVLTRMLAKCRDDRLRSMSDVVAALQPFAERREGEGAVFKQANTSPGRGRAIGASLAGGAVLLFLVCAAGFVASRFLGTSQDPRDALPERISAAVADAPSNQDAAVTVAQLGESHDATRTVAEAQTRHLKSVHQQADRLIAMLRQPGMPDHEVWRAFRSTGDATLRTELIHRLEPADVPLKRLIDRVRSETDDGIRAALLMGIGEYDLTKLAEYDAARLPALLLDRYEYDPSPAVHSAIAWLTRRWKKAAPQAAGAATTSPPSSDLARLQDGIVALRPVLEQKPVPRDGGWYQTMQGQTMVVLKGPATFTMGSPAEEPGRIVGEPLQDESQRSVTIPRTFAISTTETTEEQFRAAHERHWEQPPPKCPDCPQQGICWDDAAWYCNRLSELEGLPPIHHCYEFVSKAGAVVRYRERPDALSLPGYRLPTDEEWEFACRGATTTSRYFGQDATAVRHYVYCSETGAPQVRPVGMLKPNDFGLFDTLGNISELVHDRTDADSLRRRLRGGSAFTELTGVRAAARYYFDQNFRNERAGFRVARTMVPRKTGASRIAEVQVGPPTRPPLPQPGLGDSSVIVSKPPKQRAEFVPVAEGDIVCLGTATRGAVQPRRFRVENLTNQAMSITETYVGGVFTVEPPPQTVPPHGHAEFRIAANDRGVGARWGDLVLRFEAGDQRSTFLGYVSGNVHGAILHVFEAGVSGRARLPRMFDFGTIPFKSQAAHAFSIFHPGDVDLHIKSISVPDGFALAPGWASRIETLKFGHFRISVDTSQLGVRSGQVCIESSDGVEPVFQFKITANVIDSNAFDVVGVYRDGVWLFDENRDGVADEERIEFGRPGDRPVTGDVNGDGICDLGVCRPDAEGLLQWEFFLRGVPEQPADGFRLSFGESTAIPLLADITGVGIDRPAIVVPSHDGRTLLWRFDPDGDGRADAEHSVSFGPVNGLPVVGDWNGDDVTDLGYVISDQANNHAVYDWRLRHDENPGNDTTRKFGNRGDVPVVGDWDADGRDEIGIFRQTLELGSTNWYLDTRGLDELPTVEFVFGQIGDRPVVLHSKRAESTFSDRRRALAR